MSRGNHEQDDGFIEAPVREKGLRSRDGGLLFFPPIGAWGVGKRTLSAKERKRYAAAAKKIFKPSR